MTDGLFEFYGVLFSAIGIITYFIGRHHSSTENAEVRGQIKLLKEQLLDDMIDVHNAGQRVKEGGKVVKRNKKAAADIERQMTEEVKTSEDVTVVKKTQRNLSEKVSTGDSIGVEVKRAKDYEIKTQNIKQFSVDAILVKKDEKESKSKKNSSQDKNPQDSENSQRTHLHGNTRGR